jgi:uncharacterized protein involved in outer membrane biogenesis
VIRGVKNFTGYTMTIDGPFTLELSTAPTLSAEAIRFEPGPDEALPPFSEIGKFRIRIALWRLITGMLVIKELLAEDVVMAVIFEKEAEPEDRSSSARNIPPDIEIPIMENVRLRNIHLDLIHQAADHTVEIRLRQFDLDDINDTGPLFVKGQGSMNGNGFKLDGELGALSALFKGAQSYPVSLNMSTTGFNLSASGSIEDLLEGEGVKLYLVGETGELSHLFKLLHMDVPRLGHLKFEANVINDFSTPGLSDLRVSLAGDSRVEMAVDGSIENLLTGEGANIRFSGSCTNPNILKMVFPEYLPELNQIRLAGEVRDTGGNLAVKNLKVNAAAEQGLELTANGRLDLNEIIRAPTITHTAINIALSMPTTELLKPYTIDSLPEMGPLTAHARLTGPIERLSLEEIVVEAGVSGPLRLQVKGSIGHVPLSGDQPLSDVTVAASFFADTTAALSTVLGVTIPDFGSLKATGRITDRNGIYGMRDVNIAIGNKKKTAIILTGAIASVAKAYDLSVEGIDLNVAARDLELQRLSALLGRPLPDMGSLSGSFRLRGNQSKLAVSTIRLSTVTTQGMMKVSGDIRRIGLANGKPLEGVEVSLSARAPQLDAIPGLGGLDLPDLGPSQMKASISDRGGSLDVETFDIRSGKGKKPLLRIQGKILRIDDLKQIRLQANLETASQPWIEKYLQRRPADNYPLVGAITITGTDDGLRIKEFRLGTADERLALQARGKLSRLSASPEIDLQLSATASDPPALGSIVNVSLPPLGPLVINGRINGSRQNFAFKGKTRMGDTAFTTTISTTFAAPRPRIVARFAATVVNLEDMGIYPEAPTEPSVAASQPNSQKSDRLFDDTPLSLEDLKTVDLEIVLDADKLVGRNSTISNLNLGIRLENGRLHIYPASLIYAAGSTSFEILIDASESTPEFILKITGEDIDIEDVLAHVHRPQTLSGAFNLVLNLQSAGRSAREIASNLKGEFSAALENGRIKRIVDFLSADAFDLVFGVANRRTYTDLQCLFSKIQFENGVGTIENLFMDTPTTWAGGAGNINLADESIDLVVNSVKKKRLIKKGSALQIKGSLAKPAIQKLSRKDAYRIYGNILMPYVYLPSRALGKLMYLIKKDNDATGCVFE